MVKQGDAVVIVCPFSADVHFPVVVTWLWNGDTLSSNNLLPNVAIAPHGRSVQVIQTQQENSGRYTCTASNLAGEAQFTTLLQVLGTSFS